MLPSIELSRPEQSRCASIEPLAHRGYCRDTSADNSLSALRAALEAGWGLETDIRDSNCEIVIAHDPASTDCLRLKELFEAYDELGSTACLALNIKSCGLANRLVSLLAQFRITNYFVFDMSLP